MLGYIQSDEISTPVAWKRLPQDCKDATVSIEDERFYKHGGVDYTAIVRAAVRNMTNGKTVQGGSTITMQLVRNLYIAQPKRDYKRKIREAKLASELENEHSKTWILDQYLNTAPYVWPEHNWAHRAGSCNSGCWNNNSCGNGCGSGCGSGATSSGGSGACPCSSGTGSVGCGAGCFALDSARLG